VLPVIQAIISNFIEPQALLKFCLDAGIELWNQDFINFAADALSLLTAVIISIKDGRLIRVLLCHVFLFNKRALL